MSLTKKPIEELLKLCAVNNQLAQLEVYNRYQRAMYNTSLRIVSDTAVAEDVMQESFLTAFSKLDTFKGTATFGAWLKRIVINNSITAFKKNTKYTALPETLEGAMDDVQDGVDITDIKNEKLKQLLMSMRTLKVNYSQILTLYYIEGYDYDEISEILEISNANCRTMLSRAKESLRKKLNV